MKLIKINLVAAIAFGAVTMFTACSKDDGSIPKRIGIEDVPAMTTNIESTNTNNVGTITFSNQAAFSGKFKVAMVFPTSVPPTKVDVVVRKNASAANVKVYKANITAFPTSFTISASEIETLFGTPLALNDTYDFSPDIYVGAKKYEAFPSVGGAAGAGSGVTGMAAIGFYEFARFSVK
ncbi:hypothetical protein [Sediminibacterium soli]|uniref:hypothetical protein n=1 Tax=Sediminibacterium soli TaxID=2698829 RepID=UPI00137A4A11|nr:hypothetical protein [Sediminibacterium soli]NCI46541.1 hypothetical protein [Sediminibacterium soli]